MSLLDDLIENAQTIADGYNEYRGLIKGDVTALHFPIGITKIKEYVCQRCELLPSVEIPNTVTEIGGEAFYGCFRLLTIAIPDSVVTISGSAFSRCWSLTAVIMSNAVVYLGQEAFWECDSLKTINIPATISYIGLRAFAKCSNLENVTIENGFNCGGLNLSSSTLYSADTIVSWLNALADRTGNTAYTLYIGSTNLAKLSAEQIAIATNKNWNLA